MKASEEELEAKIAQLTTGERLRATAIMEAIPQIVGGLIKCLGPDDARMALVVSIGAVFGLQTLHGTQLQAVSEVLIAEKGFDFVIEALIARRKKK